jgi:hypothetical protein
MMFPASNAHACTVPAAPLPRRQTRTEGTWSLRHWSIVTVNRGESSDFSHVSFFGFLRRNINCEKRQGVPYRNQHGYAAGVPTVLVTAGHRIDGATVRQRALSCH